MTGRSLLRSAKLADVLPIVALSGSYRSVLARYQPLFWSEADDSRTHHLRYVAALVERRDILAFVHVTDGTIDGFVIGSLSPSPPVYAAGLTCSVDDFCLADAQDWDGVGRQLLDEVRRQARQRGATQVVVACPHFHKEKQSMLRAAGLTIASEWYTAPL
jgi:GNAT superfamily N-acetyltransferase